MGTVEEKIKSLSIEERAVEREKHILSHAVDTDDVKHIENRENHDLWISPYAKTCAISQRIRR